MDLSPPPAPTYHPAPQTYTPDAPAKNINLTPDDPQWICLVSHGLHWDLYCMLGDGQVLPSGGIATFDTVTVPQRKSVLDYSGHDLWQMSLPLVFDSWENEIDPPKRERRKEPPRFASIEKRKKRREARDRWRRYRDRHAPQTVQQYVNLITDLSQPRDRRKPPPLVRAYGRSIARHLNGEAWRITGLEWGPYLHGRAGVLRRQYLTLTLTEPNAGDEFSTKKRKRKHKKHGNDQNDMVQTYTVKEGDSLQDIAAKMYGDSEQWTKIAEANGIENPNMVGGQRPSGSGGGAPSNRYWYHNYKAFADWMEGQGASRFVGTGAWYAYLEGYADARAVNQTKMTDLHGNAVGDADRWKDKWASHDKTETMAPAGESLVGQTIKLP